MGAINRAGTTTAADIAGRVRTILAFASRSYETPPMGSRPQQT
jgi:hypothetical protein